MLLSSTLFNRAAEDQQLKRLTSDYVLTAKGSPGLPLSLLSEVESMPGVAAVTATVPSAVMIEQGKGLKSHPAKGLFLEGTAPAVHLDVREGSLQDLADDTVAVSTEMARLQNWQVGSTISVWLADGTPAKLHVVATYALSRGFGDFILSGKVAVRHGLQELADSVYVQGMPGGSDSELANGFAAVEKKWPMLSVRLPKDGQKAAHPMSSQKAAFYFLIAISAGFTAISVINTFAIATGARRQEFINLRLAGATPGQIRRMAGWEACIVTGIGILIGGLITNTILGMFSLAQVGSWQWIVEPSLYGGLLLGAATLGLFAGILTVRLTVGRLENRA